MRFTLSACVITSLFAVACLPSLGAAHAERAPIQRISASDSCSAHLPPTLAFTVGPGITLYALKGGGSLTLSLVKSSFLASWTAHHRSDHIGEFFFQPAGATHHYAGPVHAFVLGDITHICLNQRLYIDFDETANRTKHGMTMVHIDGTLSQGKAKITLTVSGKTYRLSGAVKR